MNWLWLFNIGIQDYLLVNMDHYTVIHRGPNGEGGRLYTTANVVFPAAGEFMDVRETPEKIRSKLIELRRPA